MASTYGYIQVSTREQNEARQLDALAAYGILKKHLYIDKQSGKDFNRPAWGRLMKRLRPGDLLIVKSIDRLGRNYGEILEQWRRITKETGADVLVVDMPLLDTRAGRDLTGTFIADLVLQILSYVAQTERENIRQRQAEGIASAKARGVHCGRPPKELPPDFWRQVARYQAGEIRMGELERRCGITRTAILRRLRKREEGAPHRRIPAGRERKVRLCSLPVFLLLRLLRGPFSAFYGPNCKRTKVYLLHSPEKARRKQEETT